MFRKMRRSAQEMSPERCREILARNSTGVLAVQGDEGYPYAVPLNYAYIDGQICFHCAQSGHKLDAITRNDKVSFCVIDADEVVAADYSNRYRSIIAFGRARVLDDPAEKRRVLAQLTEALVPGQREQSEKEIDLSFHQVCMIVIDVEHLTGKEARSLAQV